MIEEGKGDGRSTWRAWDLSAYKVFVEREELDDLGLGKKQKR
jgi:hypothetical protein